MELTREEIERIVDGVLERLAAPRSAAGGAAPAAGDLAGSIAAARSGTAGGYPEVMTVDQLAEYLQLHPQVLYRHIRKGNLPVSRIGKTLRFKRSVIDRWLEDSAGSSLRGEAGELDVGSAVGSAPEAAPDGEE